MCGTRNLLRSGYAKRMLVAVTALKERNEKKLRMTLAWDQGLTDEDMKKWAWGTGSAEKYPPRRAARCLEEAYRKRYSCIP